MKKIKCSICGKKFEPTSSRSKYCSEKCRKDGARENQRKLMKKKRAAKKQERSKKVNPNILSVKKRKKSKNLLKYYRDFKKRILGNEKKFNFVSRTVVEGIEVHEENFEQLVVEKIKEQSR